MDPWPWTGNGGDGVNASSWSRCFPLAPLRHPPPPFMRQDRLQWKRIQERGRDTPPTLVIVVNC